MNNDYSSSPGHAFLWKNHVERGDPSVDNMMYDPDSKCGVLTDFDLSLREPRVLGTDRTGTVPFMAIDLLTDEYWEGTLERYYHHELESFIWVIVFVFLLYQDGKRQSNSGHILSLRLWVIWLLICGLARVHEGNHKALESVE